MTGRRSSSPEPSAPAVEPEAVRSAGHIPVLLDAVLAALAPRDDAVYVDGTLGGGGYSEALLKAAILEKLNELPEGQLVMLKITLPEQDDLYADCVSHTKVVRVEPSAKGRCLASSIFC